MTSERSYGPGDLVAVNLPLPVNGPYDYRVPDGLRLEDGDLVRVPLSGRWVSGAVWGPARGGIDPARLRRVASRHHLPPLSAELRGFLDWVAGYTMSRPGAVLRMTMSVPEALDPPRPMAAVALAADPPPDLRWTEARRRVRDLLSDGVPRGMAETARVAAVSPGVVRGLRDAGALVGVDAAPRPPPARPDPGRPGPRLSEAQASGADALRRAVGNGYACTLLDGVPGSGKTEVYFEAVAETLRRGRRVLVLLPEIALSVQWLERFGRRFGGPPAIWHSGLGRAARRDTWRDVALGRAPVVVGARSALFLPFPELGLIVVDEEHDASYKQEDGVIYQARDMAVARAYRERIPIVLASATPSLETVVNADAGRYARRCLPDRHGGAAMPAVEVVDLRADRPPRDQWLSARLRDALETTLAAGEQAMLFLNRRGYAPLTLCRACGHRLQCPNCTAWLVEHRLVGRLQCHHCGFAQPLPDACPACGAVDGLAACGPGVERLSEEAARWFPDARQALATSDSLPTARAVADLVERLERREADLLIGTQIVAKGHHFPHLTLVGVIDADLGLAGGDLRAAERTFQMLYQVAGRAGRATRPGRVVVQTAIPDHPVMTALVHADRDGFLAAEADARRSAGMPPFGRLAALIVSGSDAARVDAQARALARAAPRHPRLTVLGPAPAPLALLRGRHRRRLLVRGDRDIPVQRLIRHWLSEAETVAGVRVQVDIDPHGFL